MSTGERLPIKQKNLQYALENDRITCWEIKGKKLKRLQYDASTLTRYTKRNVFYTKCWLCSPDRREFLKGDWEEWILQCYQCGRWFYKKVDITEHEKEKK